VAAVVLNRITLALAFIGVFITGVLSVGHMKGILPPCGSSSNCEKVLSSSYSSVMGMPLAYLGLVAYAFLAALALVRLIKGPAETRSLVFVGYGVAALGTIGSPFSPTSRSTSLTPSATGAWPQPPP
jgi:uncharacterized membrane protein